MRKKKEKPKSSHPWRDNIEAITISIVIIVLFKYFILEAYKIPTGSMQPTLMGFDNGKGGGVFDRVLVDKLSYQFRDPQRHEVVVFKYPLDKSKNFIKRLWGMPGEEMEIRDGDVFVRQEGGEWHIPRRSDGLLKSMLRQVDTKNEWHVPSRGWKIAGDTLIADSGGQAQFPRTKASVKDVYGDGYPGKLGAIVNRMKAHVAIHDVGDLRIEFDICASEGCREIEVEFREGFRRYRLRIPGPKAAETSRPSLALRMNGNDADPEESVAEETYRLPAGHCVTVRAENIDDLVRLWIDGDEVLRAEVPPLPQRDLSQTGINLRTQEGGAEFRDIRVWRDIYYTTSGQKYSRWNIPEGQYVMLGDNSQDSSDSRDWSLGRFQVIQDGETRVIEGNLRPGENERTSTSEESGAITFFKDDLGELHVFPAADGQRLTPQQASFVPRDLIRGRAVVVVWPIVPSMDVYRFRWVR